MIKFCTVHGREVYTQACGVLNIVQRSDPQNNLVDQFVVTLLDGQWWFVDRPTKDYIVAEVAKWRAQLNHLTDSQDDNWWKTGGKPSWEQDNEDSDET